MKTYYIYLPKINPIIFSIGKISIYWYGLMYSIGILISYYKIKLKYKKLKNKYLFNKIDNLLFIIYISGIIGGRIGYILFYEISLLYKSPLTIFKIYNGGMSFHGSLIGIIISILYFINFNIYNFFKISDFIIPIIPIIIIMGRIGNIINGELYGKITINAPLVIFYPKSQYENILFIKNNIKWKYIIDFYNNLPRHPSQLYELIFEGIINYIILNFLIKKNIFIGIKTGIFIILYGTFRIIIENFRQPNIGFKLILNFISIGQILSLPMIIIGIIIIIISNKKKIY